MSKEFIVRNFAAGDRVAVNQVAVTAWTQYASVFKGWAGLAAFIADTASWLASDAELIVAERAGLVVGVVGYVCPLRAREAVFPADWAVLRMLSVLPTERRQGIGQGLTQACIDRARHDGASTLGLHTSPAMSSALNLYLQMGFVFQNDIPARFGAPYAVYVLALADTPTSVRGSNRPGSSGADT